MKLTIGICTWNRSSLLGQALDSLTRLRIPDHAEWEVLVVNNNSTDATSAVIRDYTAQLPVRELLEPTQGKSHALNRAAGEAAGDYTLWIDDDVVVEAEWLAEYCRAFERWPSVAIFGGPIEPVFLGTPPRWIRTKWDEVAAVYAALDLGSEPIAFDDTRVPFGANMAVRTREQRMFRYDEALGPRRQSGLRGEETALVRQMLAAGLEGRWVPAARVRHLIPEDRQTPSYLRRYFRGQGMRESLQSGPTPTAMLFGKPRWAWRQALEQECKYRLARLTGRPDKWIDHLIASSTARGALEAHSGRHRQ